jgi:beta-ureidopropionase / N-carbamoyl-L-amino-acid hydrolase
MAMFCFHNSGSSSAMIFVPSRGGVSHNPREHTDDDQLLSGAQVLLDVVLRRLPLK